MFRPLWLILHTLALLAEGGVSSGSGEVAAGNGGGNNNNNGGVGGVGGGVGAGLPQNGLQPLVNPAQFQLVPVGGSFFVQPFGNAAAPQGPVVRQLQQQQQQLVPFGPFQQGGPAAGGFFLGPQGAGNLIPQAPAGVVQAGVGGVPLYTVLSQPGGPQGVPMFLQGQQLQLVPLNQQQNQNLQSQQGALLRGGAAARARRSVAARRGRTQAAAGTTGATVRPTGPEEEEESSGGDTEEQMSPV